MSGRLAGLPTRSMVHGRLESRPVGFHVSRLWPSFNQVSQSVNKAKKQFLRWWTVSFCSRLDDGNVHCSVLSHFHDVALAKLLVLGRVLRIVSRLLLFD